MSDSVNGENLPQRLQPPFPSRRELHGGRIPKLPEGERPPTPEPEEPKSDTAAAAEAPLTRVARLHQSPSKKPGSAPTAAKSVSGRKRRQRKTPEQSQTPKLAFPPQPAASTPITEDQTPPERTDPKQETAETPTNGEPTNGEFGPEETHVSEPAQETSPDKHASPLPKRSQTSAIPLVNGDGKTGRKKKSTVAHRLRTMAIIVVILALVGAGGYWAITSLGDGTLQRLNRAPEDYPGPGSGSVQVTVEPGDLGTTIGNRLYDANVVKSVEAFTSAFDSNKASASIKPGTYTLRKEMSAAEALAALLDEKNRVDNVITVNPGQTVNEIQEKMVDVAGFPADDVAAVVKNPTDVGLPEVAGGKLEGWLWPGSYEVGPDDTPATVLAQMVKPTVTYLEESGEPSTQWEEILTKASIIEREVVWEEHMPKVARVIENRLADPTGETLGMLQMDSTVNYGVGKIGGIPTDVDFANDNPYNTYLHAGLPPTPIASPSEAALAAAINPPEGDWLYFVTVNLETGETLFTDSFEEMKKNTELLTKWCAENPGKC